jgi:hypothetical protein
MFEKFSRVLVLTAAVLAVLATAGPPGAAKAAAPAKGDDGVMFSFHAPDAQAVFLAGDFNNWNAQDLAMTRQDSGDWTISVSLDPGTYEYKFIADGNWLEDPDNPDKKSDPFGGSNSVVTIGGDGAVVEAAATGSAAAAAPVPTDGQTSATVPEDFDVGAPRAVEGGILFTYKDAGAGSVTLAGTFNGWSAQDLGLTDDGKGNWTIIYSLGEGEHEYKFVVDGAWFADPANPDTKSDPYGGVNSLVIVDSGGQLIAAAEAPADDDSQKPNTILNAKLYLGGRYLTRLEFAKNRAVDSGDDYGDEPSVDPRFRMPRPTQSVDLNFEAEVSELASTYMRIRLDSDQNIIQNNIAGFLDEANIVIKPHNFDLKAYWNQEVYTGSDLLQLGGNIDLEGTIGHDHLDYGKGSAGVLFLADPIGIRTELFLANVYNHDYYGDPNLFDNTGEDKLGLRLSKKVGPVEIGTPVWMQRSLTWLDFGTAVGLPSTGIPALDEHRARTGDTSTWYETETHNYNFGLDLRVDLGSKLILGAQGSYIDLNQRFVTGNEAGQNNTNGQLDVPLLERDRRMVLGQIDFNPTDEMSFSLKHIVADMKGANADQRLLQYHFLDQSLANKRIYYTIEDSPASTDADSTDFTWEWHKESLDLGVWVRRVNRDLDYGSSGLTVPEDSTLTAHTEEVFKASVLAGLGRPGNFLGHCEIEFAFTNADAGVAAMKADSYEVIFRYDRDLTRNTGLIADLRFIQYNFEGNDSDGNLISDTPDYFAPFAGFRYTPIKKLELVLAYGIDPLDYSIDYSGRQLGRWWYRQNFLFDFPQATLLDAENYLAKARVVTLRAQLLF